jgi:putative ABC transport system ATP-binding protein
MTLVATHDLTRIHRAGATEVRALDGVSLTVERGEFVAVVGPSGSGKSTLLNLVGGLDRPTSGDIVLDGRDVSRLGEAQWALLRRRQIGFVFQFFNLIGNLPVADNVELPGLLAGRPAAEVRAAARELLAELGLEGRGAVLPGELSGGEQQRVALARALVNRPALLLADEPTGNLDSRTAREVMEVLARINRDGQTIILVTHDQAVASQADRVLRMRDGRVASDTRLDAGDAVRPGLMLGLEA